jgi:peptide/nickel transport system substrate-binding protein
MTSRLVRYALAGLLAAGASWVQDAAAQSVLRLVPNSDLKLLDPIFTPEGITVQHGLMIYDTLFAWDEALAPKPQMVGGFTVSADKLTYVFTLRDGQAFHDGQKLTSKDVVPSLRRWMARDVLGQKLRDKVASLEATDDKTVMLKLKEPYAWVEFSLASASGNPPVIMREKDAATDPGKAVSEAVGSGPFAFAAAEWVPGSKVVYKKNTAYVPRTDAPSGLAGGRVVKVDRVEWHVNPDPTTAGAALVAGEVDLYIAPPPDIVPVLRRSKDVVVDARVPDYMGVLRMNHTFPPFNDVRARQALALMIDQKDYLTAAFGGIGQPCFSFFTCSGPSQSQAGADPFTKPDAAKAKELMAAAGYKGEKIILIGAGDQAVHNSIAQITADKMRSIGLNVDLQWTDVASMAGRRAKREAPEAGGWHIFQTVLDTATLGSPMTNYPSNSTCGARNWPGWPCDEEAEKLRDRFVQAGDDASRKAALDALHARLWATIPYLNTGQYQRPSAWRTNVTGMLKAATTVFWNIEKK